jgi:polyhydroxyalkanoate synthesis regulator phasin
MAALAIMCLIKLSDIMFFDGDLFESRLKFIDIDRQISTNQKEINENILKLLKEINNGLDLSNTRISSLEKRLNKLEDKETKTT